MQGYYDRHCRFCGARLDPGTGSCPEYECYRCGSRPRELLFTRRTGCGRLEFLPLDCAHLRPAVVTTSADLYGPDDPVHLLIAAPGAARARGSLELRASGAAFASLAVELTRRGNALVTLPPLAEGAYSVHLSLPDPTGRNRVHGHAFRVAAADTSTLRAAVLDSWREDEMLAFRLALSWLAGEPYEGPVELAVLDEQDDVEIFRIDLFVRRGRVSAAFRTPEWVGPFSARLRTPGGDEASVRFFDTDPGYRDEILAQNFGARRRLSLATARGLEECHGIALLEESETDAPIQPAAMIGEKGELVASADIPRLYLQVHHPGALGRVDNAVYTGVRRGERIPLSASPPYCLYLVAADWNLEGAPFDAHQVFEGWGVFFLWNEERAIVRAPRRAAPGRPIRIEVDGSAGSEAFLVVRQKGLPSTPLQGELAAALFENIRSNCLLEPPECSLDPDEDGSDSPSLGDALEDDLELMPDLERLLEELPDDSPGEREHPPAVRTAPRQDDFRVLAARLLELGGPVEISLDAPEIPGEIECTLYQCGPAGWRVDRSEVEIGGDEYVTGAVPEFLFPDEAAEVDVRYRARSPARLSVVDSRGRALVERTVDGEGTVRFRLDQPGEFDWRLEREGERLSFPRRVDPGGRRRVVRTEFRLLSPGDEMEGEPVVVYPDPRFFRDELADVLSRYPHACSEQLTSRLHSLALLWTGPGSAAWNGHRAEVEARIRSLSRRLEEHVRSCQVSGFRLQASEEKDKNTGLWSLWPDGPEDARVSAQVLKNLAPYLGLPEFGELDALARGTARALLERGHADNELLGVDPRFRDDALATPESAAAAVLGMPAPAAGPALDRLAGWGVASPSGGLAWSGNSWAGSLETTAKVARALVRARHPMADAALLTLSDRLLDGRLYTTTDTTALLALLGDLFKYLKTLAGQARIEVDGRPVEVPPIRRTTRRYRTQPTPGEPGARGDETSGETILMPPIRASRVRCLSGRILVRRDREETIERPRATVRSDVRVTLVPAGPAPEEGALAVGRVARVELDFGKSAPETICRLYLPPTMRLGRTGTGPQWVDLPVRSERVSADCLFVRRGEGAIRALVSHMYREGETAWIEGPRVEVR
ncbi:MAG: hypothetical protein HY720_27880 [Planctomycetes bacterium]|nr:hypothetical protein [Planctomycetota bacterium]